MLSMKGSFLLNTLCHATYIFVYSLGHVVHLAYYSCILPRWCLLFQPHHFPYSPQTLFNFACFEMKPNTTNLWNHHHSLVLQNNRSYCSTTWRLMICLGPSMATKSPRPPSNISSSWETSCLKPNAWNPHLCNIKRAPYLCQPFCIPLFSPWPTFHYSIHGIP